MQTVLPEQELEAKRQFSCRHVFASSLLLIKCGGSDLEFQHNCCNFLAHRSLLKHFITHTGHELVDVPSKDRCMSPHPTHIHSTAAAPERISKAGQCHQRRCAAPVLQAGCATGLVQSPNPGPRQTPGLGPTSPCLLHCRAVAASSAPYSNKRRCPVVALHMVPV